MWFDMVVWEVRYELIIWLIGVVWFGLVWLC